jgi:hypothetical protein
MRSAVAIVNPLVSRCTDLTVEAESFSSVDYLLGLLQSAVPSILGVITVSFNLSSLSDFPEAGLSSFHFSTTSPSDTILDTPFLSYDDLTIVPTSNLLSRCVHVATANASCTFTFFQSRRHALEWSDFVGILNPRGDYQSITLRDVVFSSVFYGVNTSPPFPAVTRLDLAFSGNVRMASNVALANLPNVSTLILRLTRGEDIHCAALCGAILSTIETLQIVCEYPVSCDGEDVLPGAFSSLFSMLHRVHTLDIRYAVPAVMDGFIAASTLPAWRLGFEDDLNWHACPHLRRLDLGSISFSQLSGLISARIRLGYKQLDALSTMEITGIGEEVSSWFSSQKLCRTDYTT